MNNQILETFLKYLKESNKSDIPIMYDEQGPSDISSFLDTTGLQYTEQFIWSDKMINNEYLRIVLYSKEIAPKLCASKNSDYVLVIYKWHQPVTKTAVVFERMYSKL